MSVFVKNYVDGCATCQATKNNMHPIKTPNQPITTPTKPWSVITTDFVTDLPEINGFNSINVVVDKFSKAIVITPCHKDITAEETATLFLNNVWKRFGLPDRIISDRGPQFASQVTKEIWKTLGIKRSMSTAYHPQTDGETERVNQEIEQYLRSMIMHSPKGWLDLLPFAEFAHNNRQHSATWKSPFKVLMGYQPRFTLMPISTKAPSAEEHLSKLDQVRKEVEASQKVANQVIQEARHKYGTRAPTFAKGDKVWLDGKNLRLMYPKLSLAPKQYGPFAVKEVLGPVTYRLTLPTRWKIHDVFHLGLLMPYKETEAHGPNFMEPPPDLVEGSEEYEVEKIKNSQVHRGKLQYLVKWKGYPVLDNTWEPQGHLKNAQKHIDDFHKWIPSAPRPICTLGIDLFTMRNSLTAPFTHENA